MIPSYSIKECLQGYTNETLGALCNQWRVAVSSKAHRIRALEKLLRDPLHVRTALSKLDAGELRLLHVLAEHGPATARDLLSVPGLHALADSPRALQQLVAFGLVVAGPQGRSGAFSMLQLLRRMDIRDEAVWLFVSDIVQKLMPARPPLRIQFSPVRDEGTPQASPVRETATSAFLEMLRAVGAVSPRLTSTGELHRADAARAQEMFVEAGLTREGFLIYLMMGRELGYIATVSGRLTVDRKAEAWVEFGTAERVRMLFEAFLTAQDLPDLETFFPDLYPPMAEHLPVGSIRRTYHRTLTVALLREQAADIWFPVDSLAGTIYQVDRNVLFLEERWRALAGNVHNPSDTWKERAWAARETRLFRWMLHTVFFAFGVIELGREGEVFRITPLGRYVLGVGESPEPEDAEPVPALTVQPDFEVIAYLDRCPAYVRRRLDLFCERIRSGPVSVYRMTHDSVLRGVNSGVSIESFSRLLTTCGIRPVPDNVTRQIVTWSQKMEAVTVRRGCRVIECLTPELALKFQALNPDARRIGDRFLLLAREMPDSGEDSPQMIEYGSSPHPCLEQMPGLRMRLPWERRDLFIERRLQDVGVLEPTESGDVILTLSESKLGEKEDWSLVAAELEALAVGDLHPRYRMALRAWARELSPARTASATLIRFEDWDTCAALLDTPELHNFIEGRLGLHALVIRSGKLNAFKQAAKGYGLLFERAESIADPEPPEHWAARWVEEYQARIQQREAVPEPPEETVEDEPDGVLLPSYSPRITREILEDAIARRRPVLIAYQSTFNARARIRRVDPVTLDLSGASPALNAYCHTSKSPRTFQLARITAIRILEDETY
ncbi:MAG: helicase-associated domain-containing protein [Candidatus Hydrogenedentes bacterium]|nr:helicase-associated domain-containing protein [Candidatus Hydrogenedentota bacterium]